MYPDQSVPGQLYEDRLRAAEVARLSRVLLQRAPGHDHSPRRAIGATLIRAGLRLRGELPAVPQPTRHHPV